VDVFEDLMPDFMNVPAILQFLRCPFQGAEKGVHQSIILPISPATHALADFLLTKQLAELPCPVGTPSVTMKNGIGRELHRFECLRLARDDEGCFHILTQIHPRIFLGIIAAFFKTWFSARS
jgi:hypothetical protein